MALYKFRIIIIIIIIIMSTLLPIMPYAPASVPLKCDGWRPEDVQTRKTNEMRTKQHWKWKAICGVGGRSSRRSTCCSLAESDSHWPPESGQDVIRVYEQCSVCRPATVIVNVASPTSPLKAASDTAPPSGRAPHPCSPWLAVPS